jgi:hypothetical protein
MLERDLQDYLYAHPEILFPGQAVQERHREYVVQGRRIDLLFKVAGVRHIVELKRHTIGREDLGQVMEYYGLMRETLRAENLRMILVAPSIPSFRRTYLEELGIRCLELSVPPDGEGVQAQVEGESRAQLKRTETRLSEDRTLLPGTPLPFETFSGPSSQKAKVLSHRMLRDTLEGVRRIFPDQEVLPVAMLQATSADVFIHPQPEGLEAAPQFSAGGAWWAYRIGEADVMPKNDVPNISIAGMPGALDLTINAEIQESQGVMIRALSSRSTAFDALLKAHEGLAFQAWLKLAHQPRFYHWIPLHVFAPGSWSAERVLQSYRQAQVSFPALKATWLDRLAQNRPELSTGQSSHLERSNQTLNMALRIVRPFRESDPFWAQPYLDQARHLTEEMARLAPLVEFFLGHK